MNYSGNQLDADLPSFHLNYYISTDCNLSNNDIYLDYDTSSLGSDDNPKNEFEQLTISSNTPSGTYYILFFADADNDLNESNENNNVECVQITVTNSLNVLDSELKEHIKIYPNPVSDVLNIEANDLTNDITKIIIFNEIGQVAKEFNMANEINISALPKGIYFLHFITEDNALKRHYKLIKK